MNKRILMIAVAAAVLLIGASTSPEAAKSSGTLPWCPPICAK